MIPKVIVLSLTVLFCALVNPPASGETVKIYRDTYGVPHIYADTDEGVMYGFGYAQAEDNLRGMVKNYIRAAGKLSEFFGPDDPTLPGSDWRYLSQDYLVRLCKVRAVAEERYHELDGQTRSRVEAFAAGINLYISEQGGNLPSWVVANTPVTGVDIVAFMRWHQWTHEYNVAQQDLDGTFKEPTQSNQWAIAPAKSATGNVLLEIDPHIGWYTQHRYYEAHIVGGDFNFSGGAILGLPTFRQGHSDRIACALTANFVDLADVYEEKLNSQNSRYRFDGKWNPVTTETATFEVLGVGTFHAELRYTHGGERFVMEWDEDNHSALTGRLVSGDQIGRITQVFSMITAQNLAEFKQALAMRQCSSGNLLYGDVAGNIYYVYNARQPYKSAAYNWNEPVDGTTSDTEWGALIEFAELPQVENPPSDYLINNNVAPWFVTDGCTIDPGDYPYYLFRHEPDGSGGASFGFRQRRANDLILPDNNITMADMRDFAFDHYLIVAEWLKLLIEESVNDPIARSYVNDPQGLLDPAWQLLAGWNNDCVTQSGAATIFTVLISLAPSGLSALAPPDPSELTLQDKVSLLENLVRAAGMIRAAHGTIDVPWGTAHRIVRGSREFPVNGGSNEAQSLRLVNIDRVEDFVGYCESGSSFMMIVELSDPVQAFSALPYGQTDDPSSPHFDDATERYCNDQFKPAYFTLGDVLANLESTKELEY